MHINIFYLSHSSGFHVENSSTASGYMLSFLKDYLLNFNPLLKSGIYQTQSPGENLMENQGSKLVPYD